MDETRYHGPLPLAHTAIQTVGTPRVHVGWIVGDHVAGGPLTLVDASRTAKFTVHATQHGQMADVLGVRFGRAVRDRNHLIVGSAPGEWLVVAPIEEAASTAAGLARQVRADSALVSIVDVTHGRAMVRLTGAEAPDVLMKLCPVDLCDELVPDGGAFRTVIAALVTGVIRDDTGAGAGTVPSYLLHCERSTAAYLWDVLCDAGQEFGLQPADLAQ